MMVRDDERGGARAVVLRIRGERYAVPAAMVEEVIEDVAVSALPGLPAHAAGVVRHRGAWLPAVDAGPLLGDEARDTAVEPASQSVAAILRRGGEAYALLAEELCGILELDSAAVRETVGGAGSTRFVLDDDGAVLLLDPDTLFTSRAATRAGRAPESARSAAAFVALSAGGYDLAVDVHAVLEVRPADGTVRAQRSSAGVDAFLATPDGAVPVIDLARILAAGPSPGGMLIVTDAPGTRVAFRVDDVEGVVSASAERVLPLPHLIRANAGTALRALIADGERLRALIDLGQVLTADEARAAAGAAKRHPRPTTRGV